jgi:hypothetical protein
MDHDRTERTRNTWHYDPCYHGVHPQTQQLPLPLLFPHTMLIDNLTNANEWQKTV